MVVIQAPSAKPSRLDKEETRRACEGRWGEILEREGVPAGVLDGAHHPCPKPGCGGTDRFRLLDPKAGAVYCNQCGRDIGDGFAALMWWTSCTFQEAIAKAAWHVGMIAAQPVAASQAKAPHSPKPQQPEGDDPGKDLEFRPWHEQFAGLFCEKKSGVTAESIKAAGGQSAVYSHPERNGKRRRDEVWAFPMYAGADELTRPVGYLMATANGVPFFGAGPKTMNCKGGRSGLVNLAGLQQIKKLKAEGRLDEATVYKVEGLCDALALMSAIPRAMHDWHVVLTSGAGTENPKDLRKGKDFPAALKGVGKVYVIGDRDIAGEAAARKWRDALREESIDATALRLPYEVSESGGKDLRDWLIEGHTFEELAALPVDEGGVKGDDESAKLDLPPLDHELCLATLGLSVLEVDSDGALMVQSSYSGESTKVVSYGRIQIASLSGLAGPVALEVVRDEDADRVKTFSIGDVRISFGLAVAEIKRRQVKPIRGTVRELARLHSSRKPYVWEGRLRREETAVLVAPPKVGKTMWAYGLLVSVAANCSFLGRNVVEGCTPEGGKVLLLDSELDPSLIVSRLAAVAESYGVPWEAIADNVFVESFRQAPRSIAELRPIIEAYTGQGIDLTICDAKYRFADPGAVENDNAAETRFQMLMAEYAAALGSAVLQVHHTPKGAPGDRAKTDRGAGAGALSRAIDTFLTLTPALAEPGLAILGATTRSYAEPADMALGFAYPAWIVRDDVDPAGIKTASGSSERKSEAIGRVKATLDTSGEEYLSVSRLEALSKDDGHSSGMGRKTIEAVLRQLIAGGEVEHREMVFGGNSTMGYRLSQRVRQGSDDGPTGPPSDGGSEGGSVVP